MKKPKCYSGNTEFDPFKVLTAILCLGIICLPIILLAGIILWKLAQVLGALLFWVGVKVWATLQEWIRTRV